MASGPLSARVADLCADAGQRLAGRTQTQVEDVRRRLGEPLRVAIERVLQARPVGELPADGVEDAPLVAEPEAGDAVARRREAGGDRRQGG